MEAPHPIMTPTKALDSGAPPPAARCRGRAVVGWRLSLHRLKSGKQVPNERGHYDVFVDLGGPGFHAWSKVGGARVDFKRGESIVWIGDPALTSKKALIQSAAYVRGDANLKRTAERMKYNTRVLDALEKLT
jgi:hypothetical protein